MLGTKAGVKELMEVDSSRGGEEKMWRTWFVQSPPQRSKKCYRANSTLSSVQHLGLTVL